MFPIMIPIPKQPNLTECIETIKSDFPTLTPDVQLEAVLHCFELASDNYANAVELHSKISDSMPKVPPINEEDLVDIISHLTEKFEKETQDNGESKPGQEEIPKTEPITSTECN